MHLVEIRETLHVLYGTLLVLHGAVEAQGVEQILEIGHALFDQRSVGRCAGGERASDRIPQVAGQGV